MRLLLRPYVKIRPPKNVMPEVFYRKRSLCLVQWFPTTAPGPQVLLEKVETLNILC